MGLGSSTKILKFRSNSLELQLLSSENQVKAFIQALRKPGEGFHSGARGSGPWALKALIHPLKTSFFTTLLKSHQILKSEVITKVIQNEKITAKQLRSARISHAQAS